MTLVEKMVAIHEALLAASVPHAFGGALALAWCTERARATIDLDLNVFWAPDLAAELFTALPDGVERGEADLEAVARDGQVRLWWDDTPVDLFFNTSDFHEQAAGRLRWEPLAAQELPFLSCRDLAVFKAFFNRTRDWADLEDMAAAGNLDVDAVLGTLVRYLGAGDPRVEKLRALA